MEKLSDLEVNNLVKELRQGQEFARQLQAHLSGQMATTSHETHHFLLHRIISSYDHALSMLPPPPPPPPPTLPASSLDEDSDQDSRKRKGTWTQEVKVSTETGIEGLDDGYTWRKYGQKDILGARHPRGYYKCTHRNGQGCLATKQVQRSDEDPNTYIITYRRDHTCNPVEPPQETFFNIQTSLGMVIPNSTTNHQQTNLNLQSEAIFEDYFPLDTNNFEGLIPNSIQTTLSELSPVAPPSGTSFPTDLGSDFVFGNLGYYP